ncbi:MAG: methyltransferase family protein [Alphaproteobacteria bacterium]
MDETSPEKRDDASIYLKRDAIITNIILAALFSNFLFQYYYQIAVEAKPSAYLMFIQVTFLVIFFLIRVFPKKVSYSKRDWTVALCGTWLPMLILPTELSVEIPILTALQLLGVVVSTIGILSLNKSFGIVPALRDVKTRGMYCFVRHPIYLGYAVSFVCIVFQNFGLLNLMLLFAIIACDVMRILAEERVLSEDLEYVAYKKRVRWRLIPFVW